MIWLKLAWRNIWRNRSRTLIQLIVIAGSLAFIIWMQNISRGTYNKMIEDSVRMGSGHLSLHHKNYLEERLPELVVNYSEAVAAVASDSVIEVILPRLNISGLARSSHESASAMILGVDFAAEKLVNPIMKPARLVEGALPSNSDEKLAFVGVKLCENLRLKIGNKLVIMMQDFKGEITSRLFRVGGIFKSGVSQLDSSTVFVNRRALATGLGNSEAIHDLAVVLKDREQLKKELARINANCQGNLRAFDWETTSRQLADTIKMDHAQFKVIAVIFYLIVAFGTVNLMLMSILERTREFGLLRAMGLDRRRIRMIVFSEALVLGLVGVLAGLIIGGSLSFYTWYYGLNLSSMFAEQEVAGMLFEPIITSAWEWHWMFFLSLSMIVMVILASIYPANKALRINPGEAMRIY